MVSISMTFLVSSSSKSPKGFLKVCQIQVDPTMLKHLQEYQGKIIKATNTYRYTNTHVNYHKRYSAHRETMYIHRELC